MFRTYKYNSDDTTNILENYFTKDGFGNTGSYDLTTVQNDSGERKNNSFQADLGYDQKIGDNGQNISISGSLQNNKGYNNTISSLRSVSTSNTVANQTIDNQIYSNSDSRTYLGKADYELPIGEKSKIEAGTRYDYTKNVYDNSVFQSVDNAPSTTITDFTGNTTYIEKNCRCIRTI